MIDTLMVLWNKGYSGRGLMASLAFLIICISISLLLITINGIWGLVGSDTRVAHGGGGFGGMSGDNQNGSTDIQGCRNTGLGNSVGMTGASSALEVLRQEVWFILGSSLFGTLLFYVAVYLAYRKRNS